jgi:hypothetical protein
MHIAVIGATAFVLFVVIGGLLMAAVLLEQRTRRQMAAAAEAPAEVPAPVDAVAAVEKPKAMAASAGR